MGVVRGCDCLLAAVGSDLIFQTRGEYIKAKSETTEN